MTHSLTNKLLPPSIGRRGYVHEFTFIGMAKEHTEFMNWLNNTVKKGFRYQKHRPIMIEPPGGGRSMGGLSLSSTLGRKQVIVCKAPVATLIKMTWHV